MTDPIEAAETVTIPKADYELLLMASEADDMVIRCEVCGAWLYRDDEATATIEDFSGCWKAATRRPENDHLCRSHRAPDALAVSTASVIRAALTAAADAAAPEVGDVVKRLRARANLLEGGTDWGESLRDELRRAADMLEALAGKP